MDDSAQTKLNDLTNPQNVSSGNAVTKEAEPFPISPKAETQAILSETEPSLSEDVEKAGVTVVPQEHPLPQDLRELGIDAAKEAKQPSLNPTLNVPLTQDQAKKASGGSVSDSLTWLATLITMLFKKEKLTKDKA